MTSGANGTGDRTGDRADSGSGEAVPDLVETPRAELVYQYVRTTDGASADRITEALEMSRVSVLAVLSTLTRRRVLEDAGGEYVVADRLS